MGHVCSAVLDWLLQWNVALSPGAPPFRQLCWQAIDFIDHGDFVDLINFLGET
jgi:hypothetical protein